MVGRDGSQAPRGDVDDRFTCGRSLTVVACKAAAGLKGDRFLTVVGMTDGRVREGGQRR